MVAVSVIVPARDAADTLGATLAALAAQELADSYEVIVVDDASTDATADMAAHAGARVVRLGHAHGPGGARNAGVRAAEGALLAFTDADCAPAPGWLAAGVAALDRADLVQGAVRPDPAAVRTPFDRTVEVTGERGFYETASLFVRREAFDRVGGFEDWLAQDGAGDRPPIGEDVLFGWSVRRAGGRTAFSADALVHHAVLPGDAAGFLRERARLRHFPALARRVPELRDHAFYGRLFLSRRSAMFDLALAGLAVAGVARRPAALAAAAPYAWRAARRIARAGPRRGTAIVVLDVVADAAGCVALVAGSLRHRTPLL